MAEAVIGAVVQRITDYASDLCSRQIDYLLHCRRNIEDLRTQVGRLEDKKNDVQGSVIAANRNGEVIKSEVESWLNSATGTTAEGHTFLENGVPGCFHYGSRYRLSKEAKRKVEDIVMQLQRAERFDCVSYPPPPPDMESIPAGDFVPFQSTTSAFNEVMEALHDNNVNIAGICGMGGVGKTTLVKEIGRQAKRDRHFDEVLMAVVSQTPNITWIQDQITEMLGLKLTEGTQLVRAARISNKLSEILAKKSILIILDDIWARLELTDIGIPAGENQTNLKILLSTRRRQVCQVMGCHKLTILSVLSEEDSWCLFKSKAGDAVEYPSLKGVPREVASECGGLPIAIVTVGRALRNTTDLKQWEEAARELRNATPTNIEDVDTKVYASLKMSYDYLRSPELKQIFLLCSLFPEDHDIDIETLVFYGVGKQIFHDRIEDNMDHLRNKASTVLNNLKASCLLMEGRRKETVKMHDVVRDVAHLIASANMVNTFIVAASSGQKKWPIKRKLEHCTSISLMQNDIRELPNGLNYENLKILLLQGNHGLRDIPDGFFQGMRSLEVLDVSSTGRWRVPTSMRLLKNLRTLRAKSTSIEGDISIFGELNSLEIFDLEQAEVKELPEEIGQLTNLRMLNFSKIIGLMKISSNTISCLTHIEELYMDWKGWTEDTNACVVDLKSFSQLTTLHMGIKHVENLPRDLCMNLKRFCICVGRYHNGSVRAPTSLYLGIETPLVDGIKVLLEKAAVVYFTHSKYKRNGLLDFNEMGSSLTCLRYLNVTACNGIQYLMQATELNDISVFHCCPNLKRLEIHDLSDLKEIWFGLLPPRTECFWKLDHLVVENCSKLLNVVSFDLLTRSTNLEHVLVDRCAALEAVFDLYTDEEISSQGGDDPLLSNLTTLELDDLWKLKKIWMGSTRLVSLRSLKLVAVRRCSQLKHIFSPALAQTLQQLENLDIRDCDELEEVVAGKEEELTVEKIVFNNLHTLVLKSLKNLSSFSSGGFSLEFPSLEKLVVEDCHTMKTFTSRFLRTPKLNTIQLKFYDSSRTLWLEDPNATIQHLFNTEAHVDEFTYEE